MINSHPVATTHVILSATPHHTPGVLVLKASGLRSVFLASWSLDPRAVTDQAAAAGRSTANRIKNCQFARGQPRVSEPALSALIIGGGRESVDKIYVRFVVLVRKTGMFVGSGWLSSRTAAHQVCLASSSTTTEHLPIGTITTLQLLDIAQPGNIRRGSVFVACVRR